MELAATAELAELGVAALQLVPVGVDQVGRLEGHGWGRVPEDWAEDGIEVNAKRGDWHLTPAIRHPEPCEGPKWLRASPWVLRTAQNDDFR